MADECRCAPMKTSLAPYIIAGVVAAYLYSIDYKAVAVLLAAVAFSARLSFMHEERIDRIERRLDNMDRQDDEDRHRT